jgi:signal transduction histidine kinase
MTTTDEVFCVAQTRESNRLDDRRTNALEFLQVIDALHRRIGQDLHDGIEQELVGLGLISEALLKRLMIEQGAISQESIQSYQEIARTLVEGFTRLQVELQSISRGLVPAIGFHENLAESLEALAKRTDLIHGIACSFCSVGTVPSVSAGIALQLYRIAQESVCNALKHSGADRILIAMEVAQGRTTMQVADNGNGFHHDHTPVGLGIQSMQYRAELIGAKLQISTSTTGGTVVCCTLSGSKDV